MIIRFHNLGTIEETELDLRPMTVIIGRNNTNKTYIAYSVYGLWQYLHSGARPPTTDMVSSGDAFTINVETLRKDFTTFTRRAVAAFEKELAVFYQDSSRSLFSKTHYEVDVSATDFTRALGNLSGQTVRMPTNGLPEFRMSLEETNVLLRPTGPPPAALFDDDDDDDNNDEWKLHRAGNLLNAQLRRSVFPKPYLLPAERNAFVITYKVLANRRLKLLLNAQRRMFSEERKSKQRQQDLLREAGEVRYPQPIEDFLDLLFDIETNVKPMPLPDEGASARTRVIRRSTQRTNIRKLATDIEQNIQDGNKISFTQTALGGQEIMVNVGNGLSIDLYNASSSIKQLTPLLLYLQYRASKGDLLVIDEPEMNLHPESQVKFLEVLAMLVNQGVNVLLTTHSPFLLAHLNNLAQSSDVPSRARSNQAASLYLKNAEAILDMNDISAYEMRDGKLHNLKDPDYGIRYDTFSDVSTDLQQKYFELYEAGHTQTRAKNAQKPRTTSR